MGTKRVLIVMELEQPYAHHYKVFAGIQDYAQQHTNWSIFVGQHIELQIAEGERFDGIIGRIAPSHLETAQKYSIPVVSVKLNSPISSQVPLVAVDFRAAGRMTAEHLIARGFRELAHCGYKAGPASEQHFYGMKDVAQNHGYPCHRYLFSKYYDQDREQWMKFLKSVKKIQSKWKVPIGLGVMADDLCRSLSSILISMGWKVSDQLALVGCGNNEMICSAIRPTLSSVDMGYQFNGFQAAKLLDHLMAGNRSPSKLVLTPVKELVVRGSSDAFAVSDPKVAQALRFMADNLSRVISVPTIAKEVRLGRQSLERRFRCCIGRGINEQLIRLRVEALKRLIVDTDKSIKTASAEVGFRTSVNMHTMFKRLTGATPAEYRRTHNPPIEQAVRSHVKQAHKKVRAGGPI